jgi:hypothetical protein
MHLTLKKEATRPAGANILQQQARATCYCVKRWNPIAKNSPFAFERLFHERGLPRAIRSNNGVPFASPHGLFQLSKQQGQGMQVRRFPGRVQSRKTS